MTAGYRFGTWQETSHETNTMIEGVPVRLQANGTVVWRQNGAETSRAPLIGNVAPERYSCSGNRMHQFGPAMTWGPTREIKLQRIA